MPRKFPVVRELRWLSGCLALLLAGPALSQEDERQFKKDENGLLTAEAYQRLAGYQEMLANNGQLEVHVSVLRLSEEIEKLESKRLDQARYFAETKSAILDDMAPLILEVLGNPRPDMPGMYLLVRPGALTFMTNDPRITTVNVVDGEAGTGHSDPG